MSKHAIYIQESQLPQKERAHLTSLNHTMQKPFDMFNPALTVNHKVYLYRASASNSH